MGRGALVCVVAALSLQIAAAQNETPPPPVGDPGDTLRLHRSQTTDVDLELVGQVGGEARGVAVHENDVYVGIGLRLVLLDMSVPGAPVQRGATEPFPSFVEDIAVISREAGGAEQTLAFVAAGGAGLRVVDVSQPTAPVEVGAWDSPGYAEGVATTGDSVYLADGPYGLRVLDVSDPSNPVPAGSAYPLNYAFDVAVSEQHVYVAGAGAGLLVADVSVPENPTELGSLDTPGYSYGVAMCGQGVVCIADGWGGLHTAAIEDPSAPELLGTCGTPGWALDVAFRDGTAYVADGSSGLRAVDVSAPLNPRTLGTLEGGWLARRLAVAGNAVYLVDPDEGLRQIDVTNPTQPEEIGRYSSFADATYVAVDTPYAYIAAGFGGLRIIDVSAPDSPVEVSRYDTGGSYAAAVAVDGVSAYVPTYLNSNDSRDLHIVDITDPLNPTLAATLETPGTFRHVTTQDDVLYVADEWGLRTFDVSDPYAPSELGFIQLTDGLWMTEVVDVSGDLACVGTFGYGIRLVDVSDPANMALLGTFEEFANGVAVDDDTAYVTSAQGLHVVDVSDPARPQQVGYADTPGYPMLVTYDGSRVFIGDGGSGLQVMDAEQAADPVPIAQYDTPGFAWQSAVEGSRVYLADRWGGLAVLEIPTGGAPGKRASSTPQPRTAPPRTEHPGPRPQPTAASPLSTPSSATSHRPDPRSVRHTNPYTPHAARAVGATTINDASRPVGPATTGRELAGARATRQSCAPSSTLTVTSSADNGPGTLRDALLNVQPGGTVQFDPATFPPSHPQTITLETPLPDLTHDTVTIDAGNAGVILDGSQIADAMAGLFVTSDGNTLRGLRVRGFPEMAICIGGDRNLIGGNRETGSAPLGQGNQFGGNNGGLVLWGNENTVRGNLFGTDANGESADGNAVGIRVEGAGNHIGGPTPGERNIISGNSFRGIQMLGANARFNVVAGNFIGLDVTGFHELPNTHGIVIEVGSSDNTIGGTRPEQRNIISGNDQNAIIISDAALHNTVIGNWIGTDASGEAPLGNLHGIHLANVSFNRIGGTQPGEGNVISGNLGSAIDAATYGYSDNIIVGNRIGVTAPGEQPLGNGAGISLHVNTERTFVGGATGAETNIIADSNLGIQVSMAGTDHNWILGNLIGTGPRRTERLGNHEVGILVEDSAGRTIIQGNTVAHNGGTHVPWESGICIATGSRNTLRRNSIYDNEPAGILLTDGGNDDLPPPAITDAGPGAAFGTACADCLVQIFSDRSDQGRIYEGQTLADGNGYWAFTGDLSGPNVTATATNDAGNTSGFSNPVCLRPPRRTTERP